MSIWAHLGRMVRCAVTLLECTYAHQVAPAEYQFGGDL